MGRQRQEQHVVEAIDRDGVDSIVGITERLSEEDWSAPACGAWDRADTVRHVAAVAD